MSEPSKTEYVPPHVDDKELFLRVVGAILDHPSVYMGGASQQSRRRAERIWDELHFGRYGWKLTRDASMAPPLTPNMSERDETDGLSD